MFARATAGQTPYPAATAPDSGWGGYELPAQVPYQPTLPPDPSAASTLDAGPIWQPSAPPTTDAWGQAVTLEGTAPMAAPIPVPGTVPADPGYSITSEPDLKQSLIPMGARNGFFQKAKF